MRKFLTLLALILLPLIVGCRGGTDPAPGGGEVKIGVVLSLSGPAATYGQECLNGLKLAVEEQNAKRTRKITLIVLDDKSESIETVNSVNQVIDVNKVVGVIGATASTNTLAAAKISQESRVPLLVPMSTNAAITKTGDFVARICFNDPFQGQVLAKFARKQLKVSRAVIVTDKAIDYSVGLAKSYRDSFTAEGGAIAGEVSYTSGDADFSALIASVKALNPDVIFIPGQYADVGPMLKQSKGAWDNIPKLGGDGWDSHTLIELAGPSAYGSFICSHFAPDDPNQRVQQFVKAYKAKHSAVPGAMACLGYDAGLVLANALSRIDGEPTSVKLKDAINSTKGVEGITGVISLNDQREVIKDAVILEVTRDGFKFKARINP